MNALTRKALTGFAQLEIILAALLFLPAWSIRFWEAWVYLGVFGACALLITFHFLKRDPALIERRLAAGPAAEQEKSQKIIQVFASLLWCALFVVPGIERRFHPTVVPPPIVIAADAIVVLGFTIIFFVFRENSHTSAVIEVAADQRVISTGPYRLVRHPMYAGAALLLLATPPALGSLRALACAVLLCGVIVARLLDEERFLVTSLPGYEAYRREVRYRLIPYVW